MWSASGLPWQDNVWFGVDAWMPKYLKPEIINFIASRMGQDRAVCGTNGLPWKESLDQVDGLGPEGDQDVDPGHP